MPENRIRREIKVEGARENNLQNISLSIPKDKLTVITGVSGSGKSSLAFDTIYAEGQRRYLDTFSSYARQMIGKLEKPDVDDIKGLSPVISIEQKTTGWNPRSTVGTVTELYDYLRLLYARTAEAYSYLTGNKMVSYSESQIIEHILSKFEGQKIVILGPVVRGRKGHYRELFEQYRKMGFTKVRADGKILDLKTGLKLDRYKTHDIEIVIDRIKVVENKERRLSTAIATALEMGKGLLFIENINEAQTYTFSKQLMDPESGLSYEKPSPNTFSFNSPYGYCSKCKGIGSLHKTDLEKVIPDDNMTIGQGGIKPIGEERSNMNFKQLRAIANHFEFSFATAIKDIPKEALEIILYGGDDRFHIAYKFHTEDFTYSLAKDGLIKMLEGWYANTSSEKVRNWASDFMSIVSCPECDGSRLKKTALYFRLGDKNIADLARMDMKQLYDWILNLPLHLNKKQVRIGTELLKEIENRLAFILEVGLEYLTLNRPARTLSGGESQRTRLATQIGSKLTGITYILDEPSIGLHARDNEKLILALKDLTEIGNTVIVVEHDKEIMEASDHIIDLGPGAGIHGGEVTAQGSYQELNGGNSLTAAFLRHTKQIPIPEIRRKGNGEKLVLTGATGHNLKRVKLSIPLGTFCCVTGVSGSGKSTLIHNTLYPILRAHFYNSSKRPLPYNKISGLEHLDKVIEIDQKPIGRTPRSNPATYTGLFTEIRKIFSLIPESKIRGYKPGRYSFNVKGGRCETCRGAGKRVIEMNFLPDVMVDCESCMGRRYNRETLEIHFKGKNINDVLEMPVEEAYTFFESIPKIERKLKTLLDVGLGYITLGQQATTLSGGEAQRVKLAEELSKRATGKTMYILDEPTTGLHFNDIRYLLDVLNKLVDKGNTVLMIEHNMDIIKSSDYIIDMGPEGGEAGGNIISEGTPEQLARKRKSYTGQFLKKEFQ
jgi:excinuclease ABC subunit A